MGGGDFLLWFFIALAVILLGFYVIDYFLWEVARKRVEKTLREEDGLSQYDYLIEYGKVKGTMGDVPFTIEIEGGVITLRFGWRGNEGTSVCDSLEEAFDILHGQVYLERKAQG